MNKNITISDEDFLYYLELEKEWKKSLPNLTLKQWVDIFPEAKGYVKRKLRNQIKQYKQDMSKALEIERETNKMIKEKASPENQWFWKAAVKYLITDKLWKNKEKMIKKNAFILASFNQQNNKEQKKPGKINDRDIEQARDVSLDNFLEFNRSDFVSCPFHTDKTPSMKYYRKQERWYCFSCNKGGDIINFIMSYHNYSFIEAVKFLINK